ncbi:MAG: delta-aminolevulinic acid dehydratase [Bacteroidetes bacterium]|nr:delta-aminolevulinic acid dehydratase [Bacteroidota bacterium]
MFISEKPMAAIPTEHAIARLQQYIESEKYRGADPYDALKSPVFKWPVLRTNKMIRFGMQQLLKRIPFNLRPLLRVPKGYNPVTLGLCIQAYTNQIIAHPEHKQKSLEKISFLMDELEKLIPKGFAGSCWGYDFDWEARYARIPAYQPTIVATGFITNALFQARKLQATTGISGIASVRLHLYLMTLTVLMTESEILFSYSPFDKEIVFNASMKGARTLAQVYSVTQNDTLKELALKAVAFVMRYQQENGAWIYSMSKAGTWVDNYHTGYILDCLDEVIRHTGDQTYIPHRTKGYAFIVRIFSNTKASRNFTIQKHIRLIVLLLHNRC